MEYFFSMIIIGIVISVICRLLASRFKIIRIIAGLIPWGVAIINWIDGGFWSGVIALFISAIVVTIIFGSQIFDDEDEEKDIKDIPYINKYPIKSDNVMTTSEEIIKDIQWKTKYVNDLLTKGNEDNRYFMQLNEDQKAKVLMPFMALSETTDLYFQKKDGGYGPNNPGYYLGQLDEKGNQDGFGIYIYPWQVNSDREYRYYITKFFLGPFRYNGMDDNKGIFITLSSDGKHDKIEKKNDFYVTREKGVCEYK